MYFVHLNIQHMKKEKNHKYFYTCVVVCFAIWYMPSFGFLEALVHKSSNLSLS